ncbi:cell division protein FtsZ [Candidatus Saccharibacteria bacterium]|nr:cell division protein FtsZ [Candidatus Saccharibacteria bacterium]
MPKVEPAIESFARIKVVGVGGAGGAAINRMVDAGVTGVDFVAINADAQALHHSKANHKVHIGETTTKGLGTGADPALGQKAAEESADVIDKALKGADMIFVTFGAGGGTGSGAGPIVAKLAQDNGSLVVGFTTKPFAFEGDKRRRNADLAVDKLRKYVDTLIVVPNDKLLQTIDRRTPLLEAFKVADDVLRQGVQGISDLITVHGLVNLDFADVKTVMADAGTALMGIGRASGENRAIEAATQAISSPLLEVSIDGARGILFNVIGGNDMSMHEINTVAETITAAADPDANIIFGATINPDVEGEIIVTVVATGFDETYYASRDRKAAQLLRQTAASTNDDQTTDDQASQTVDEATMAAVSSDLKQNDSTKDEDFHSDTPNIWALTDDVNGPADDSGQSPAGEEDLDEPSFLRRFLGGKRSSRHQPAPEPAPEPEPIAETEESEAPAETETETAEAAETADDKDQPAEETASDKPTPADKEKSDKSSGQKGKKSKK